MSYFDKNKKVRLRLCMDPKERFPEKVFKVANDNFLIKWDGSGESVIVKPEYFEENVMKCYPGFLQISTFLNLRRLFREYGFGWKINPDDSFEFSHECFLRNQPNLLEDIVTRRKSFYRPSTPRAFTPPQTSTPLGKRRSSSRRAALASRQRLHECLEIKSPKLISNIDTVCDEVSIVSSKQDSESTADTSRFKTDSLRKLDPALLQLYAKNELTEEEILLMLGRQNGILSHIEEPKLDNGFKRGFEWMYLYCDSDNTWPNVNSTCVDFVENSDNICRQPSLGSNHATLVPVSDQTSTQPCCPCRCHGDDK